MSDLNQQFEQAQKDVVSLAERPENAVLLKLYAYYKQATEGDVSVKNQACLIWLPRKNTLLGKKSKARLLMKPSNCTLRKYKVC